MNVQNQIPRIPGVADTTDSPERLSASDCSASVGDIILTYNGSENELRHAHQGIGQSSPTESDCILRLKRMWGGLLCGPKHVDPMWPEYLGKTFQPNIHLEECRSAIRLWDEAGRPDPKSWLDQMEAVNSQETNRGIRVLRKSYSSWVECAGKPNDLAVATASTEDSSSDGSLRAVATSALFGPFSRMTDEQKRSFERNMFHDWLNSPANQLRATQPDLPATCNHAYPNPMRKLALLIRSSKDACRRWSASIGEVLGLRSVRYDPQQKSQELESTPDVDGSCAQSAEDRCAHARVLPPASSGAHQCSYSVDSICPNDPARRHGDTTSSPEEKVCPLEKGIKEVHDAVFGAAPCSGSLEEKTYSWDGFPVPFHECYFCTGDIIGIGSFKNAISAYHPKSGNFYIIAAAGWELTVEELDTTEEVKQALFHSFCQCPSGSIKENPMSGIHCARRKLPPREAEYFLSYLTPHRHSENRDER